MPGRAAHATQAERIEGAQPPSTRTTGARRRDCRAGRRARRCRGRQFAATETRALSQRARAGCASTCFENLFAADLMAFFISSRNFLPTGAGSLLNSRSSVSRRLQFSLRNISIPPPLSLTSSCLFASEMGALGKREALTENKRSKMKGARA